MLTTKHLQSLIALNSNRITALHDKQDEFVADAKAARVSNMKQIYKKAVRKVAFYGANNVGKDIVKAVELQRALKAELLIKRATEKEENKSRFFIKVKGTWPETHYVEVKNGQTTLHTHKGEAIVQYYNFENGLAMGLIIEVNKRPKSK